MLEDKLLFLLLLALASVAMASGLAPTKPQLFANPTYACALRSTGHVDCWGRGPSGGFFAAPTDQQFWSISSGVSFTCALAYDGRVQCWGEDAPSYSWPAQAVLVRDDAMCVRTDDLRFECPAMTAENGQGILAALSISQLAFNRNRTCAVVADYAFIFCWDREGFQVPMGSNDWLPAQLVLSDSWTCGVQQSTGTIQCQTEISMFVDEWGNLVTTQSTPPLPPAGMFLPGTLVTNGDDFCALSVDHMAACWGNSYPQGPPNSISTTPFVQLAIGEGFACGLQASGVPLCWGDDAQGVLSPPEGVTFVLLAASSGYACGMRDDEVTVCWGANAPPDRPCPTACLGNGTLDAAECRCQCPSIGQICTCPVDRCKNGGRLRDDGACSCECHNTCGGTGCVRQADCSCSCAATQPQADLATLADADPKSLSYRIAGGESTFPVKRLTGRTIAGATECSKAMLSLSLPDTAAWSGASCADSGSLFLGANMAHLDINQHTMASVRFSGDMGGGWLYRIVKCAPENNTLLLCPRNWVIDSVHCPGPDRDCSQCLPRGRGLNSTAAYTSTCTKGPPTAVASQLRSVILAGGYSGYHAEPSESNWLVPLPSGVTCATRFLMFRSQEWHTLPAPNSVTLGMQQLLLLLVQFHADGNGDYRYIYRGCDEATSSLLLEPYQWTISPEHCPDLDCSSCLASSQGECLPSNMGPNGLVATSGPDSSVILSWSDDGAPAGTTYAVYIRTANTPSIRYTTSSRQLQVSLEGLGTNIKARVVRVHCPITCPTGGCYPNSLAGSQLARSEAEGDECEGGVVDCRGECNGTTLQNPCGLCTLPADYYMGDDYWVDCANTCGGSAYISECGVCVGGRSGLPLNAHKDCQGTCFGNATRDECGVCHAENDHRSSRDCTGLCGGKAVVDQCGQCALGTTGRELNADMDCAGQCFGKRLPTDPACRCELTHLDKCFVCGGDNSQCAGCDGVPNSGTVRDLCGVCGGDNTTCCFLPFPQATVVIRNFQAIAVRSTLDAGETLLVQNLHEGRAYTVTLARIDDDSEAQQPRIYSQLQPGNSLHIEISQPGKYQLTTVESSTVLTLFTVRYNAKTTDACGHCIDAELLDDALPMHMEAYEHCCSVMESNNVHAWFATTHYSDDHVVQRSENYRSDPTRHHLRLVKPQMVDTSVWSAVGQRLAVGDVVVLENRDLLDHVISVTGPQPMPDVVLDRGTVAVIGPVRTPGTYRVESKSNLINTTFTVEFAFACTLHANEQLPEVGYPAGVLGLTLAGTCTLALLLLALLGAVIAVVAVHQKAKRGTSIALWGGGGHHRVVQSKPLNSTSLVFPSCVQSVHLQGGS